MQVESSHKPVRGGLRPHARTGRVAQKRNEEKERAQIAHRAGSTPYNAPKQILHKQASPTRCRGQTEHAVRPRVGAACSHMVVRHLLNVGTIGGIACTIG